MIVRIARKLKAGYRAEFFVAESLEQAQAYADRKGQIMQYDESQQEHYLPYIDKFRHISNMPGEKK